MPAKPCTGGSPWPQMGTELHFRATAALADLTDALHGSCAYLLTLLRRGVHALTSIRDKVGYRRQGIALAFHRRSPAYRRQEQQLRDLAAQYRLNTPLDPLDAVGTLRVTMQRAFTDNTHVFQRAADSFRNLYASMLDWNMEYTLPMYYPRGQLLPHEHRMWDARRMMRARTAHFALLTRVMLRLLKHALPAWRFHLASDDAQRMLIAVPLFPLARVHRMQENNNPPPPPLHYPCRCAGE